MSDKYEYAAIDPKFEDFAAKASELGDEGYRLGML